MRSRASASPGDDDIALRALQGVQVKLSGDARAAARMPWGYAMTARRLSTLAALLVSVLLMCVVPAQALANEASTIIEKCTNGESFSGYSQKGYREALKHMPTEVSEYSPCPNLIRKAELASEGGGGGSSSASGVSPTVALPLTPTEQRAVQRAHHHGSAPVRVGSEPIKPGVVHANIASAVNTLPHSLFAVLALMFAGAVALSAREVVKRVRTHRDS